MSNVYILGAGFSRAIGHEMPLLRDLSNQVHNKMKLEGRWEPTWGTNLQQNVELLATHLISSHPWETPADRHRGLEKFYQVTTIMEQRLLSAELKTMKQDKPDWLLALCGHWLDQSADVVSFNYDTLVERTVATLGPEGPTMAASLFPTPITPANDRWKSVAVLGGTPPKRRFSLLKLHGSLNWWYSGPEAPPGDVVYGTTMHAQWGEDGWTDEVPAAVADKVRLIVPPTLSKDDFYANGVLRHQWRVGRAALARADRIVLMGYSLPPSDLTAALLVATAQTGCFVEVVDSNPAAHISIRERLPGFKVEQHFHGDSAIADFVATLSPIRAAEPLQGQ